jgi:uncharacterized protein YqeY
MNTIDMKQDTKQCRHAVDKITVRRLQTDDKQYHSDTDKTTINDDEKITVYWQMIKTESVT